MARGDPSADVFAIPDFGQTSEWLQLATQDAPPTLFTPNLGRLSGHSPSPRAEAGEAAATAFFEHGASGMSLDTVAVESYGFFKLLPLGRVEPKPADIQPERHHACTSSPGPRNTGDTRDNWDDTAEPSVGKVGFRTWDAFKARDFAAHQPIFVSEAGPATYDALLCQLTDPPELRNSDAAIVEARTYLSCLLALALGRDSILFRKNEKLHGFHPPLPSFRISGYSRQILQGVENQALQCGGAFMQLSTFVRDAYAKDSSRCEVALASSISHVLQAVEQRLAVDGSKPRSLLQLQASVRDVLTALAPLQRLVSRLRRDSSDEETLSLIFDVASSLDDGQGFVRVVVREVLRRVSAPWLELLEEWIGTRREHGIPLSKSRLGESRGFVKVEADVYIDDFGRETQDVDFRLDRSKVPDFMPNDVAESMFETGRDVRFIRAFHPHHPLAQQAVIDSAQPPKADWLYDWPSMMDLERRITRYRNSLCETLRLHRRASDFIGRDITVAVPTPSSAFRLDFFGLDQDGMEERMAASIKELDQPVTRAKDEISQGRVLRERLFDMTDADLDQASATPHWSLLPILSFGGLAAAQAHVFSRETLRLLFDAHDLRGQLRLQRDFHLFGNGIFCSRLSHALFDPDLTSAERQAGIARQGVMGLRLGGRDAWPPASSELRLVLMGVLAESHASRDGPSSAMRTGGSRLLGDLSFAVRELSVEEIDQCMDPDSLEALDFLRLAYKTPAELSDLITPTHLLHYDRIFKLLLRVLRMQYVTNQQCLGVKARGDGRRRLSNARLRFNCEAHHFVSSVASYFLDVGVAVPWQVFEQRLDQMRADLDEDGPVASTKASGGPKELREAHSQALDGIMHALFLRKRQQPVLKLLEELFGVVLRYAKHARTAALREKDEASGGEPDGRYDDEAAQLYAEFRKKMQVFMTVCRGLSEKSRAGGGRAREEAGAGDDGLVAQLLMKLDMGSFYIDHG